MYIPSDLGPAHFAKDILFQDGLLVEFHQIKADSLELSVENVTVETGSPHTMVSLFNCISVILNSMKIYNLTTKIRCSIFIKNKEKSLFFVSWEYGKMLS